MKNLYLLLMLISFNALSQGTIKGIVMDAATEESLPFATVAIYKDGKLLNGMDTDLDGKYEFKNVPYGEYIMEAQFVGYDLMKTNIVLNKKSIDVNFKLSDGILLDEVEISAYKRPLVDVNNTTSGSTVTAEKIRSLPVTNIGAIAATSAGMSSNGNIAIRGSRSNPTTYYVDGVRIQGNSYEHVNDPANYSPIIENEYSNPIMEPLSTLSIDVDRAAYATVRNYLNNDQLPPPNAVRIEEMINYFNYDYKHRGKKPFSMDATLTSCPWQTGHQLLHIAMQAQRIDKKDLPPSNLIFLVDVSGSMSSANKLGLVKKSLVMLTEELRSEDKVSIVVYAGSEGLALPCTSGKDKAKIIEAIQHLSSGGSTAGAAGIELAYKVALENFIEDGNNRVILATDGDFNVGISSDKALVQLIEQKRKSGVFLSILGYGMGNYKDGKMQKLTTAGNGNHNYIDNIQEAEKVFKEEMAGTLYDIAKDVKIQLEFNPGTVKDYRMIGYENRVLEAEDFNDDTKDAGELGAGHSVTFIYEIIPADGYTADIDELVYQEHRPKFKNTQDLGLLKYRYKPRNNNKSIKDDQVIRYKIKEWSKLSDQIKWSIAVAEFGLILRDSKFKGDASLSQVLDIITPIPDKDQYKQQFVELVNKSMVLKNEL